MRFFLFVSTFLFLHLADAGNQPLSVKKYNKIIEAIESDDEKVSELIPEGTDPIEILGFFQSAIDKISRVEDGVCTSKAFFSLLEKGLPSSYKPRREDEAKVSRYTTDVVIFKNSEIFLVQYQDQELQLLMKGCANLIAEIALKAQWSHFLERRYDLLGKFKPNLLPAEEAGALTEETIDANRRFNTLELAFSIACKKGDNNSCKRLEEMSEERKSNIARIRADRIAEKQQQEMAAADAKRLEFEASPEKTLLDICRSKAHADFVKKTLSNKKLRRLAKAYGHDGSKIDATTEMILEVDQNSINVNTAKFMEQTGKMPDLKRCPKLLKESDERLQQNIFGK